MIKRKHLTLILIFASSSLMASEFKFNYKNLNSLGALICSQVQDKLQPNQVQVSKFTIDKTSLGPAKNHAQYELTGSCNAILSKKTQEVLSYGEELQIEFNLKRLGHVSGTVGINKIDLYFDGKKLKKMTIEKISTAKLKSLNLNKIKWAKNNSLFDLNKKNKIQLRLKGRIVASEAQSNLNFKNHGTYYSIWSFGSFGCNGQAKIIPNQCETLSDKI